MFKVIAFGN